MKSAARKNRRSSGFTLIEASISLVLVGLIMLTVWDLFGFMLRTTIAANSAAFASGDSNKALNHITSCMREARWFALPDDSSPVFSAPTGCQESGGGSCQVSDFETSFGGNVDAGIEIVFPAGGPSPTVALSSGTHSLPIYDRDTDGATLYVYRSNSNGTPNAATGTCLWESGTDNGVAVNKALISSIASVPNAVQFERPSTTGFQVSGYEVDVKIVSGYYSPISGTATNESTNGTQVTTLTGKCVLLRDCELDSSPHAGTGSAGTHWSSH